MDKNEVKDVIGRAFEAAKLATDTMVSNNPGVTYPCGFAWVRIKPARGPLIQTLKEMKAGSTDDFQGGFVVHNPSKNPTQWMSAKFSGARAFANVLREAGVNCIAQERMD